MFNSIVERSYIEHTGDDVFVIWGAASNPANVTFRNCTAINPGIMRPNWYGNCVATYGLQSAVFEHITCRAPTLAQPIPFPDDGSLRIDTSMVVFFTDFDAVYPAINRVDLRALVFTDLHGEVYTAANGSWNQPMPGRMAWTRSEPSGIAAPYYFQDPKHTQTVHVYVGPP